LKSLNFTDDSPEKRNFGSNCFLNLASAVVLAYLGHYDGVIESADAAHQAELIKDAACCVQEDMEDNQVAEDVDGN
jgi:hypothetical protein